jgi:hypothetical protein
MKDEITLTIPNLMRNPGGRVVGFLLSPEWSIREDIHDIYSRVSSLKEQLPNIS